MVHLTYLQSVSVYFVTAAIFLSIIAFYIFGHYLKRRSIRINPKKINHDLGSINGALLALLGLLLAFTFSMASARFDTRRQLIIEEANNIGTVFLRTEIYPDSIQKVLKTNLKEYVDARIAFSQGGVDVPKLVKNFLHADAVGKKLWTNVADYAKIDPTTTRTSEIIPALNDMIDITTTRRAAGESTIPDSIMYFLFALCISSAFLLGYDNKTKIDWIVIFGFAIMLSATVFTIIDLDRPRSGLINMDTPTQKLIELKGLFKE